MLTNADFPATTTWLTDEERHLATARLQIRKEVVEDMTHKEAFVAALKDPKTWVSRVVQVWADVIAIHDHIQCSE